jgi:hypothetical protein
MNKDLEFYARGALVERLATLPKANQEIFKLMYGRLNGKRSLADTKTMSIKDVVAEMEAEKLDWAMTQVNNSIAQLLKAGPVKEEVPSTRTPRGRD